MQSLAHHKQQYDPLIYMHKVLLSWQSKAVLFMFAQSICMYVLFVNLSTFPSVHLQFAQGFSRVLQSHRSLACQM